MTRNAVTLGVAFIALSGCGEPEEGALDSVQLLVPDDVSLHWDQSFNGDEDGLGALVPVDVMLYERDSGEPVEGIQVSVQSEFEGAYVVPLNGVELVEPESCEDCPALWDAWRDKYFQYGFVDDFEAPGHELLLQTDLDGLARVYLYVDVFPDEGTDFAPVPVLVSAGISDETFYLVPQ